METKWKLIKLHSLKNDVTKELLTVVTFLLLVQSSV
jgi:hypothetical protein